MVYKKEDFAEKIIKFVLSRSNEELGRLTGTRICKILKISRSHMHYTLKHHRDITPAALLRAVKMQRSARLLQEDDSATVKSVAEKMGFSCDHFNQVFSRHFGISPGKFRECVNRSKESTD